MILDTARRIAAAEGWSAVTIRRVASALGYTSPLIYEHFRDKGDALAAVLHEGFDALVAELAAAAAAPLDPAAPDEYVHALAETYFAFARREPAVYQLMNGMGGVAVDPVDTARGAELTGGIAVDALRRWSGAAGVRLPDPLEATEVLWCALHGITCLAIIGRLDDVHQQAAGDASVGYDADAHTDALLHQAVRALLAGWRAIYR